MKKIIFIVIALITMIAVAVLAVLWFRSTPDELLVQKYQSRFDERKAELDRAMEALPPVGANAILDKTKLAEVRDTHIPLIDLKTLKSSVEVYQQRIDDPFAARLLYWKPRQMYKDEAVGFNPIDGVWPKDRNKLEGAYETFLNDWPRYLIVVRQIQWTNPTYEKSNIYAGSVDLEVFLLDLSKAEVIASKHIVYNQADVGSIKVSESSSIRSQAESDLLKSVNGRIHLWVVPMFADAQTVKIGSMRYDMNDVLQEPKVRVTFIQGMPPFVLP